MLNTNSPTWLDRDLDDSMNTTLNKLFYKKKPQTVIKDFLAIVSSNLESKGDLFSTPWTVSWQIDSNCNLRCKHCFFSESQHLFDNKNDLSSKKALELTDALINDLHIVTITLTGGEPLLRKDLFEILRRLKMKNICICLHTNGTLITLEIAKELGQILNPKVDLVQVSLDGASDEVHNQTRGQGIFKKASDGIKLLVECGLSVNINCTVLSTNLLEIPNLYNLCCELNVKKFSLNKFIPCNENQKNLVPDLNILFKAIAEIIDKSEKEESSVFFELSAIKLFDLVGHKELRDKIDTYILSNKINRDCGKNVLCHSHNAIFISPDGKVYLCFPSKEDGTELGDFKKESLLDIWRKRKNHIFFKERCSDKMLCKKCKYFSLCRGGCMASAYLKYNDVHSPDGMCEYAKEMLS